MEKHKDEACDYYEIHEDSMEIINKTMPEETELEDLADLFKIFGDSCRIRILFRKAQSVYGFYKNPYSVCAFRNRGMCMRPCESTEYDTVCNFPSA